MRLRLALLSLLLLSVPATPQVTVTDGTSFPAVRSAPSPVQTRGRAVHPAPGPTSKSATPIRPSLITAAEATRVSAAVSPLEAIRWCESRHDYRAKNPDSSASGAFQAIDSTWEWVMDLPAPASAYPRDVQDEFFYRLWDDGDGASHWAPSAECWEPILETGVRPP